MGAKAERTASPMGKWFGLVLALLCWSCSHSAGPADVGPDAADAGADAGVDAGADDAGAAGDDGGPAEDSGPCTDAQVPQPNTGMAEPPGIGGCPAGMNPIYDRGVCIDRYEAFLVEVLGDGSLAPWSPYFNPGTHRVRAVSAPGAVPQGYIDELQAAAACAEAGKRLCTQAEWEYACRGPDNTTYPYGEPRQDGACNDARAVHPAVEYFGTSADWIWSELGHPCLNQLPDSLDPAGANPGCVTPGGVFDLMGNLHEWIDDPEGTFKGGYYVDTRLNGEGCLYTTTAHNIYHWDYSTGFRCCAEP
jgi:hypothetical protein